MEVKEEIWSGSNLMDLRDDSTGQLFKVSLSRTSVAAELWNIFIFLCPVNFVFILIRQKSMLGKTREFWWVLIWLCLIWKTHLHLLDSMWHISHLDISDIFQIFLFFFFTLNPLIYVIYFFKYFVAIIKHHYVPLADFRIAFCLQLLASQYDTLLALISSNFMFLIPSQIRAQTS